VPQGISSISLAPMRILLLNQFFYPDSAATSQLLTDLARCLAAQGHSVRVICGNSSLRDWFTFG